MKAILLSAVITLSTISAFADHSLLYAMNSNSLVGGTIQDAISAKKVVCDLDHSMQMSVPSKGENEAWRQVALCFATQKDMEAATEVLKKGNEFGGLYGIPATAVLDVTYSFENAMAKKILKLSLK